MSTAKQKRTIVGDCVAQRLQSRPKCIPIGRPRGVKALGLRYERAVNGALTALGAQVGPWFAFADLNGAGFCQPDGILPINVVYEVKLTNWKQAEEQLKGLYLPVVAKATRQRACGLIILRHLSAEIDLTRVFPSIHDAIYAASRLNVIPIWHWLGKGPI